MENNKKLKKEKVVKIFFEYFNTSLTYNEMSKKHNIEKYKFKQIVNLNHKFTKDLVSKEEFEKLRKEKENILNDKRRKYSKEICRRLFDEYFEKKEVTSESLSEKHEIVQSTVLEIIRGDHWSVKNYKAKEELQKLRTKKKKNINKRKRNEDINKEEALDLIEKYYNSTITLEELSEKKDISLGNLSYIIGCKHWTTRHLKDKIRNLKENKQKILEENKENNKEKISEDIAKKIFDEYYETDISIINLGIKYEFSNRIISEIINCRHSSTKEFYDKVNLKELKLNKPGNNFKRNILT